MRDAVGQFKGLDVDILTAIGQKQRFRVKFLVQPWSTALPSLETNERDIVAAGVVITPELQENYKLCFF